jgi:hypothetical protein
MRKIVRLTESDLIKLVKRVISESEEKKFDVDNIDGVKKWSSIESALKEPELDRIKEGEWNYHHATLIFKHEGSIYVAPATKHNKEKCEEFFGSRKGGLGVPQLNEKSKWFTKSAWDDFWK